MKRTKRQPIPQKEFGFTRETFNLVLETTHDGEQIAREHEQAEKACEFANKAQATLFQTES